MMILVGVTVTVAINGGLFNKTKDAGMEMEKSTIHEQIISAMKLTDDGKVMRQETYDSAKVFLEEQGYTVGELQTDGTFEVTGKKGTYKYQILEREIIISRKTDAEIPPEGDGNEIIPEGAVYTTASGIVYNAGDNFPETVLEGDIYVYGDYKYTYRTCYFDGDWFDKLTYEEEFETSLEGWSVIVLDKTKSQYGEILSNVNGENVTNLVSTFAECESLVTAPIIPDTVIDLFYTFVYCNNLETAPSIPSGVINMGSTFSECESLVEAPIIPDNVIDMGGTFYECISLTNVPNIPSKVTNLGITFYHCSALTTVPAIPSMVECMEETFSGCKLLEGEVEINANPSETKSCFFGTEKPIVLTGLASNETKQRLKNTSSGNITWE